MKKYIDVTLKINEETIIYPGDAKFEKDPVCSINEGDICNVTAISMGTHTGTHIDAPRHFYKNGRTIDNLELEKLIGHVKVFALEDVDVIKDKHIRDFNIEKGDRVIFKTKNSKYLLEGEFRQDFVYLDKSAADYLIEKGVILIGIDSLSIEQFNSDFHEVHFDLLEKEVVIVEALDLNEVEEGDYEIIALPLKIEDGDGSPARVILVKSE